MASSTYNNDGSKKEDQEGQSSLGWHTDLPSRCVAVVASLIIASWLITLLITQQYLQRNANGYHLRRRIFTVIDWTRDYSTEKSSLILVHKKIDNSECHNDSSLDEIVIQSHHANTKTDNCEQDNEYQPQANPYTNGDVSVDQKHTAVHSALETT